MLEQQFASKTKSYFVLVALLAGLVLPVCSGRVLAASTSTVTPSSGPPGSTYILQASGLTANYSGYLVTWKIDEYDNYDRINLTTDAGGNVNATLRVRSGLTP